MGRFITHQYVYEIENAKYLMSPCDHPAIVSRFITKFAGTAKHAVQRTQVDAGKYHSPDGYLEFIEWLRNAVGITPYEEENKLFET